MEQSKTAVSLHEFNMRVKKLLTDRSVQNCWIHAELSDVAERGGHCYLELIEKDQNTGATIAKVRGIIWANRFRTLRMAFMQVTGQDLKSGLKVMVEVSVNYHEQFGLSLVISDIDPTYTIGDMERRRREILNRLSAEGIINMNRELEVPIMPQRIAVVSAAGAAGYGDFMNQIHNNQYGLKYYTCLFPATMQGVTTAPTIKAALSRINDNLDLFDCVVIIRGGGATSDLNSFDDYELAAHVAQFPIPVIVGIGHERDVTVLDYVAGVRVKTPTAAAEWLIAQGVKAITHTEELKRTVLDTAGEYIASARQQLQYITGTIPLLARNHVDRSKSHLEHIMAIVPMTAQNMVKGCGERLQFMGNAMLQASLQVLAKEKMRLTAIADKVTILSPHNTLRRGYSLTTVNGKAVTDASSLNPGDEVVTSLATGSITSTVKQITENNK